MSTCKDEEAQSVVLSFAGNTDVNDDLKIC